jgi:hypothetical protein
MAFSSITPAKLGRGAVDTTPTLTTVYTVPTLTRAIVKTIDLCNTTAAALTVTVYLVEAGGTAGASNTLIPGVTIPPNGVFQWTGTQILNASDKIQATASGAGITINASGGEAV